MRVLHALALFLPLLPVGCRPPDPLPLDPLTRALEPWPEWIPGLERLDWGAPELARLGELVIGREEFEAYLCNRFAAPWIAVRAFLALCGREDAAGLGPPPAAQALLEARAGLAAALGIAEDRLQQELLALGWGQVRLLDLLRARLVLWPEGDPALLPGRLLDLQADALGGRVQELAARNATHDWRRSHRRPRVLAWHRGEPIVESAELKPDLLGALTEGDRDLALREFLALRVAEEALGGPRPLAAARLGEDPAKEWLAALRQRFQAGPGREAAPSALLAAAKAGAGRRVRATLLLVPALRPGTGRPGLRGDRRRAQAEARALLGRLRAGADPAELAAECAASVPEGPARGAVEQVGALSGQVCGLADLESLGGPLQGLGAGCDAALALILASPGEWRELPLRSGRLLFRIEKVVPSGAESEAGELLHRLRFRAWLAERLGIPAASP